MIDVLALFFSFISFGSAEASNLQVSTGWRHACVVRSSGAECWGYNNVGQLGDGTTVDRLDPTPVVGLQSGVVEISAGGSHTCAVTGGGQAWCFGRNEHGQLGDGSTTNRSIASSVTGIPEPVVSIAAGALHNCALTDRGSVWCWGGNEFGQIGDGSNTDRATPVQVSGLEADIVQISAGYAHSCALTTGGAVWCWGENTYGQLGDGTKQHRLLPTAIVQLRSGVSAIAAGFGHTCGISSDGAMCWGRNGVGQVGSVTDLAYTTSPERVVGLSRDVARLAAGGNSTCAVDKGALLCWGGSIPSQSDNGFYSASQPTLVPELSGGLESIATSGDFGCAAKDDAVFCWGDNSYGQVGNGTTETDFTPVRISFTH